MEVVLKYLLRHVAKTRKDGFNPCFDGSGSEIRFQSVFDSVPKVSILVLMEVVLKFFYIYNWFTGINVSILVLMEVVLKFCSNVSFYISFYVSILVLMEV